MAVTPPTNTVIDTPPTPRHAGEASRHYSTRKSTRHNTARSLRAANTPPSDTDDLSGKTGSSRLQKPSSPRSSAVPPHSPPSSAHTSPRTRVSRHRKPKRSNHMNDVIGPEIFFDERQRANNAGQNNGKLLGVNASHMLPTPASLPRKKQFPRKEVDAAARILFPPIADTVNEVMPTPRKHRKGRKHVGFSLYSSMEDDEAEAEEQVQIYTDSRDKVPELDPSKDNPFLDRAQEDVPSVDTSIRRSGRKRKLRPGVETDPRIEDAFNRDEGMVYVFRGKKVYRPFPPSSDSERGDSPAASGHDDTTMDNVELPNVRPFTRSSIKPRLLFPTAQQQAERSAAVLADEEALTDIEDPSKRHPNTVVTPIKRSFEPATPPASGHVTRSTTQKARDNTLSPPDQNIGDSSTDVPVPRKRVSPFNGWARTKSGVGAPKGKKRDAEALESFGGDGAKRVRGGTS